VTPANYRRKQSHGPSDNYHETTTKNQKWWNEESKNRCLRSERFVLVRLLAVAQIASARACSTAVSYRSWLVLGACWKNIPISFELISARLILEIGG
jgi:hypothetical protein